MISAKRHQTRFYPISNKNETEKNHNTQNGTVVDRGIKLARYWEFTSPPAQASRAPSNPCLSMLEGNHPSWCRWLYARCHPSSSASAFVTYQRRRNKDFLGLDALTQAIE
ncbi:hypothetical protein H9L39_01506 [Fusarium oxysporum f. sp. albedinis]|nr:hypothetical protein H9L39_01506 [Fusarium oxysporum f. sp. albedinis]